MDKLELKHRQVWLEFSLSIFHRAQTRARVITENLTNQPKYSKIQLNSARLQRGLALENHVHKSKPTLTRH